MLRKVILFFVSLAELLEIFDLYRQLAQWLPYLNDLKDSLERL